MLYRDNGKEDGDCYLFRALGFGTQGYTYRGFLDFGLMALGRELRGLGFLVQGLGF